MKNIVQKIPFLRITIAFVIGLILAEFEFDQIRVILFVTPLFLMLLYILNYWYKYTLTLYFGILVNVLFIAFGILRYHSFNQKPSFYDSGIFEAILLEKPVEKKNSFQTILLCKRVLEKDTTISTNEKIIAYLQKGEAVKLLDCGDKLVFRKIPTPIKNAGNPYEFNYKKYLQRKKIHRQVYLSTSDWAKTEQHKNFSIRIKSQQWREKLVTRYTNEALHENELEILSALTLGDKKSLDPETKRVFSSAGAMHVLAVSGLHVGIIYWVIVLLFGFLRNRRNGKFAFVLLSLGLLWFYAIITGSSPSVLRATTMFSIYIIGENLRRKTNTYNSLAASALILLLIHPNNLFEIGFQLSYAAVFGIVYLQPKIAGLLNIKNKVLLFFWNLLAVSIAAQVATFPFTSYYFGQFPLYFFITNIIVIPAVMLLIPLGITLLFVSKIVWLSNLLSVVLNIMIKKVFLALKTIEKLPYSVLEISQNQIQFFFVALLLLSFFIFMETKKPKHLKFILVSLLTFISYSGYLNYSKSTSSKLFVYNSPSNPVIQLCHGNKNFIISEKTISEGDYIMASINQSRKMLRLDSAKFFVSKDTFKSPELFFKNGIILFNGRKIAFNLPSSEVYNTIDFDYIICTKSSEMPIIGTLPKPILLQTYNRYSLPEKESNQAAYNTTIRGFYSEEWKNSTLIQYLFASE